MKWFLAILVSGVVALSLVSQQATRLRGGGTEITMATVEAFGARVAGSPTQYRIAGPVIIQSLVRLGLPPITAIALPFGLILFAILLVSWATNRGGNEWIVFALTGLVLTATQSNADCLLGRHLEALIAVLAVWLIRKERYWFLPGLLVLGTLNREGTVFMALAAGLASIWSPKLRIPAVLSLAGTVGVCLIFRVVYPHQAQSVMWGHHPGLDMLRMNFELVHTNPAIWRNNAWCYIASIVLPLIVIFRPGKTPLRVYGAGLTLIWLAVILTCACAWETSLLIAPVLGGLIPAVIPESSIPC